VTIVKTLETFLLTSVTFRLDGADLVRDEVVADNKVAGRHIETFLRYVSRHQQIAVLHITFALQTYTRYDTIRYDTIRYDTIC